MQRLNVAGSRGVASEVGPKTKDVDRSGRVHAIVEPVVPTGIEANVVICVPRTVTEHVADDVVIPGPALDRDGRLIVDLRWVFPNHAVAVNGVAVPGAVDEVPAHLIHHP